MTLVSRGPWSSRSARFVVVAVAILACAATRLKAGAFTWTSQGPWGGSMSALAPAPSDSSTIYAGTFFGRAFRSVDGGATWTQTAKFGTTYVSALAVDPTDPQTVYVASGNGTYKSVDGGDHWTFSLNGPSGSVVAVDPENRDRVYASIRGGTGDHLYRSDDGGAFWIEITGILDDSGVVGIRALAFDPAGILYAGTSNGVFQSPDFGETWLPSSVGMTDLYVQALVIDPSNSAILYAATEVGGIFRSVDHAASWSPANNGLPFLNVSALLATTTNVFASVAYAAVYQSADGAQTWTPTGPGLPDPVLANAFAAVGPGTNSVLAGTSRGIFRSTDAGGLWGSSNTGLSANPAFSLAVSAVSSEVFAGTSTGFFHSTDEGQSWQEPANLGLGNVPTSAVGGVAVDPTDDATLYASVSPCCGIYKTTDGGGNWSLTALHGIFNPDLPIDPQNPSTVYALQAFGGVYKTTDGGMIWAPMNSGIPAGLTFTTLAIDPNTPQTLFAATQPGGASPTQTTSVYRTTDGAMSWSPTAGLEGPFVYAIAVAPSDSSIVYAATGPGLYVSADGGANWTPTGGPGGYSVAVDPLNASTVYGGTIGEGVYRSADGGATWIALSNGGTDLTAYELKTDTVGSVLYAGTPSGVFDYRLSFLDVPESDPFHDVIGTIAVNGITIGCGAGNYCPDPPLSRAQSAVFLLRSLHGGGFQPPQATGLLFSDVPSDSFAAAWIEELSTEGITSGCGGGNFCPDAALTRAEAAVFLLRAKHGPTHAPPPATGGVFGDVPADAFAADWIEELALEGITSGCGGGNYCPAAPTTRGQAAALLVRTFALQ